MGNGDCTWQTRGSISETDNAVRQSRPSEIQETIAVPWARELLGKSRWNHSIETFKHLYYKIFQRFVLVICIEKSTFEISGRDRTIGKTNRSRACSFVSQSSNFWMSLVRDRKRRSWNLVKPSESPPAWAAAEAEIADPYVVASLLRVRR